MAVAGKVAITLATENGGAWSADVTYDRLVAVKHNNNFYISRKMVANVEPPNDEFWFLALEGYSGEDVQALIDSMNAVISGVTQVGNAKTLDGHGAEYFATKTYVSDLSNDLSVERARIDSLTSLPEGSTTADAELIDIRVKADGTTATSAGNAVREQVTELKRDLTDVNGKLKSLYNDSIHDENTNYIDLNSLTENAYIKGQEQGQEVSASGFYATDFIELEEGVNYYNYGLFKGYFAFYGSNKQYIIGYGNGNYLTNPFTIPSGAKYGRFTIADLSSSGNNWIYTENERPPEFVMIHGGISENVLSIDNKTNLIKTADNPLAQIIPYAGYGGIIRKWGIIGDSLSSGEMQCYDADGNQAFLDMYQYSWGQHFARIVGADCYNFSNGGQTAYGWVKDYGTVHDESYIGGVGGGTWATAQTNLRDGYIIALGVNDLAMINRGEYPLGDTTTDINADYNLNAKTFVGYYASIIQRIKTIQPKAKFFCVTPLGTDYADMNIQIRRIVANFSNTYLIDLDVYAPKDRVIDGYMLQGHLSPLGYMYTSYMINTYIDWIIKNNASDFIDTALIGTTYKTSNS